MTKHANTLNMEQRKNVANTITYMNTSYPMFMRDMRKNMLLSDSIAEADLVRLYGVVLAYDGLSMDRETIMAAISQIHPDISEKYRAELDRKDQQYQRFGGM